MANLFKRAHRKLYRIMPVYRKIARVLMKNKIRGGVTKTVYLSHCNITADDSNEVVFADSDYTIVNVHININGKNNKIIFHENLRVESSLTINIVGSNNMIEIGEYNRFILNATDISLQGENCKIITQQCCKFDNARILCSGNGTTISIGKELDSQNPLLIDAMEDRNIIIGNNVLMASNVKIRNNDGHSILDKDGKRINPAKDVIIGDNIWICADVSILKGTVIPNGCVIGTKSLCSSPFKNENALIFGIPAMERKQDICWKFR